MYFEKRFLFSKRGFISTILIYLFLLFFFTYIFKQIKIEVFLQYILLNLLGLILPTIAICYLYNFEAKKIMGIKFSLVYLPYYILSILSIFMLYIFTLSLYFFAKQIFVIESIENISFINNALPLKKIIIISILSAISEELAFKGIVFNIGLRNFNHTMLIIWLSIFFEIIHFREGYYIFYGCLVNILLFSIYYISNDLILSIINHIFWNLLVIIDLRKYIANLLEYNFLSVYISLIVSFIFLLYLIKILDKEVKYSNNKKEKLNKGEIYV